MTDTKISYKIIIENYFCRKTVIYKEKNWPLLWKCVRVGWGPCGAFERSLDQSCDSTSRLGVETITHLHLHLDKRQIKENLLKTFSINKIQLFSYVNLRKYFNPSWPLRYDLRLQNTKFKIEDSHGKYEIFLDCPDFFQVIFSRFFSWFICQISFRAFFWELSIIISKHYPIRFWYVIFKIRTIRFFFWPSTFFISLQRTLSFWTCS